MSDNNSQTGWNVFFLIAIIGLGILAYSLQSENRKLQDEERKLLASDGERITALESMKGDMRELDQNLDSLQKLLAPGQNPQENNSPSQASEPPSPETSDQGTAQNQTPNATQAKESPVVNPVRDIGGKPNAGRASEPEPDHVITYGSVRVEVFGCRATGDVATCTFVVQNEGDGCLVQFYTDAILARDDRGNEAHAVEAIFADHNIENSVAYGNVLFARMAKGASTSAAFRFAKISTDAQSIALIYLRMDVDHRAKFDGEIRNIPLAR